MAKALTAISVEKAKADPSKRQEIADGLLTGLYLIVQPTGRKSWAVRYRSFGKPRKLALGAYPAIDLAKARELAKAELRRVQEGVDPAAEKQSSKKRARDKDEDNSRFDSVVRTFLARHAKPKNKSWKETARQLGLIPDKSQPDKADDPKSFVAVKGELADKWGHRPIESIRRAEIIDWLDDIVDRPAPVLANRTLAALRKLFNWSIERGRLEANPCSKIKPPHEESSRDRVLSESELRALWLACEEIGWPFGPLFKVLTLTGQRRDEIGAMTWREIAGDMLHLPAERTKNGLAHDVPLSPVVLAILDGLPRIGSAGYVFTTTGINPVSGFSKAKRAVDEKMLAILHKEAVDAGGDPDAVTIAHWQLHDLRRTAASGMQKLQVNLPVIERTLNHISGSFAGVVGTYQRHEFADEKRAALNAWSTYVQHLATMQPSDNVIPMRRR